MIEMVGEDKVWEDLGETEADEKAAVARRPVIWRVR